LKGDYRYTIETVFESFAWPQWSPFLPASGVSISKPNSKESKVQIAANVSDKARRLREIRNRILTENQWSLRKLYRSLELPGSNELRDAHEALDQAVQAAYLFGLPKETGKLSRLELLLRLNELVAEAEKSGNKVVEPGLPDFCKNYSRFFSNDCIRLQE
jgi:hypothetical protein